MESDGAKPQAVYSGENIEVAYQLDWSLTIFWREPLWTDDWLDSLQQAMEPDGIRLLKHRFSEPQISLFLVSTKPDVLPINIPRRVKGRLQHILRDRVKKPFQRNYDLRSIGSTTREKLEGYLGSRTRTPSRRGSDNSLDALGYASDSARCGSLAAAIQLAWPLLVEFASRHGQ